ncbi:somatomedin-B and thrombospondin type-1 domain-containing protein [Lepisosteus oculatus]|uniref:somatomedin-B and thrombospondin type-1 domain-containing protein n=1 Tax=Lepisosteus oculatus TaxID=7918 RepID=UPI0037227E88
MRRSLAKGVGLLLLTALLGRLHMAEGGCSQKCCQDKDLTCRTSDWRVDRTYGTCFCDEGCQLTRDCCFDYTAECPARPCVVGEWSPWSGCVQQCRPAYRVRRRRVEQEPRNGGQACPPLEERAGCLEYLSSRGQTCAQAQGAAFITSLAYSKGRRKRDLSAELEDPGYCMEFQMGSLSHHCALESRAHARWMQYLREGYTVCVLCQPPAMSDAGHSCQGDGTGIEGNRILQWQAVGNPRCRGTWRKIQKVEHCSCPVVHSFVFI